MRSDREHCALRIAVEEEDEERRRGGEEEEKRRRRGGEEEEKATDTKSNNPHLSRGETISWSIHLIVLGSMVIQK